ncbi:uncharacterized protein RAG0_06887 [Rhynchosporium agropyri]|uniref:Uncharacterized protein n=1 Tax=Rhynchosporium agropyri TaxID=914238 RepID=A0A1E1KIY9_9HELO|nr:uncharacterized protein RAG0_06887 [Rhynchosporium agropyri]
MAVEQSGKAIEQAHDVNEDAAHRTLTTLAPIFIPLSFVAAVFGMNVKTFNPDIDVPVWSFFATALPITALSVALVWYWDWISRAAPMVRNSLHAFIMKWVRRLGVVSVLKLLKGSVAKGFALAGATSLAVESPAFQVFSRPPAE